MHIYLYGLIIQRRQNIYYLTNKKRKYMEIPTAFVNYFQDLDFIKNITKKIKIITPIKNGMNNCFQREKPVQKNVIIIRLLDNSRGTAGSLFLPSLTSASRM